MSTNIFYLLIIIYFFIFLISLFILFTYIYCGFDMDVHSLFGHSLLFLHVYLWFLIFCDAGNFTSLWGDAKDIWVVLSAFILGRNTPQAFQVKLSTTYWIICYNGL